MIVIPIQKCTDLVLERWPFLSTIAGPPQAFLPQGPVEALNVRLLILLIGTGHPMPCAILVDQLGKRAFEFWPTIGLDDLHGAGEAAGHGRAQKHGPMLTRQSGLQDHIRFLRIDIHTGEGKHIAKKPRYPFE